MPSPYMRQLDTISIFLLTLAQTTTHHDLPSSASYETPLLESPFTSVDTSLEFTYGITPTLASFIFLTRKLWSYARSIGSDEVFAIAHVSEPIVSLAQSLNAWKTTSEQFSTIIADDAATLCLARHLANSFHCAAKIYFYSCFRFDEPNVEQPDMIELSEQTLFALEKAEIGKIRLSGTGASIGWPAFVAACEAPPELRPKWTKYWEAFINYRIGNIQIVWDIVKEVWKRTDEKDSSERSGMDVVAHLGPISICTPKWIEVLKDRKATILAI